MLHHGAAQTCCCQACVGAMCCSSGDQTAGCAACRPSLNSMRLLGPGVQTAAACLSRILLHSGCMSLLHMCCVAVVVSPPRALRAGRTSTPCLTSTLSCARRPRSTRLPLTSCMQWCTTSACTRGALASWACRPGGRLAPALRCLPGAPLAPGRLWAHCRGFTAVLVLFRLPACLPPPGLGCAQCLSALHELHHLPAPADSAACAPLPPHPSPRPQVRPGDPGQAERVLAPGRQPAAGHHKRAHREPQQPGGQGAAAG
jgi:hypothetical protein